MRAPKAPFSPFRRCRGLSLPCPTREPQLRPGRLASADGTIHTRIPNGLPSRSIKAFKASSLEDVSSIYLCPFCKGQARALPPRFPRLPATPAPATAALGATAGANRQPTTPLAQGTANCMECRGKGKLWPGKVNVERLFKLRHIHQGASDRAEWRARPRPAPPPQSPAQPLLTRRDVTPGNILATLSAGIHGGEGEGEGDQEACGRGPLSHRSCSRPAGADGRFRTYPPAGRWTPGWAGSSFPGTRTTSPGRRRTRRRRRRRSRRSEAGRRLPVGP